MLLYTVYQLVDHVLHSYGFIDAGMFLVQNSRLQSKQGGLFKIERLFDVFIPWIIGVTHIVELDHIAIDLTLHLLEVLGADVLYVLTLLLYSTVYVIHLLLNDFDLIWENLEILVCLIWKKCLWFISNIGNGWWNIEIDFVEPCRNFALHLFDCGVHVSNWFVKLGIGLSEPLLNLGVLGANLYTLDLKFLAHSFK